MNHGTSDLGGNARTGWPTTTALVLGELSGSFSLLVMPFVLSAMMESFRLSEAAAGRLVSLELLGMTLGSALASAVVRPGRSLRPVLAVGAGAIILANIACALVHAPLAAILARTVTGLGEGVVMAATATAVCATPNPHRIFSILGLATAVIAMGALPGAPFASSLAGPAGVYLLVAMMSVPLFALLPQIPPAPVVDRSHDRVDQGTMWRRAPVLLAYLAFWAGASGMWVYAERVGASQGLTPQQVGFWLSLGQIGGLPGPLVAAWAGPRFGLRACIVVGCLSMAVAVLSFVFGGQPWTYGLGGFLASFWLVFCIPCFRSRMAALDPSGRTVALSVAAYTIGFGIAPLIVSSVTTEASGYTPTGVICLVCFVLSALLGTVQLSGETSRLVSQGSP